MWCSWSQASACGFANSFRATGMNWIARETADQPGRLELADLARVGDHPRGARPALRCV
jgi:hypothetical protein